MAPKPDALPDEARRGVPHAYPRFNEQFRSTLLDPHWSLPARPEGGSMQQQVVVFPKAHSERRVKALLERS